MAALTGDGDAVTIQDGQVTIGLATIIDAVKAQLIDAGFAIADRIPEVDATFTLFESADLDLVQKVLGFIDGLSTWLPVIVLGLLAVAVVIARDRRRVVFAAGLAVAASMLLLGVALNGIRPFYLDALPASSSQAAAGVLYDQVVSFIRFALRGVLVVGVAVAIGAWLSAPRGSGAAARSGITRGIDAVRRGGARAGMDTGRLGVVPPAVPRRGPHRRPGGGRALVPLDRPPHRQHCSLVRGRCRRYPADHRAPGGARRLTHRAAELTADDGSSP